MRTIQARIHSLGGQFAEVTIVSENGCDDVIVDYKGIRCTAIYNPFVGCYYVDDIYGIIRSTKNDATRND